MSVEAISEARSGRADGPLDTTVRLVTPERVTFFYPLAGPFRRAVAYLLDLFICAVVIILGIIAAVFSSIYVFNGTGLFFVLWFVLQWGYGATWEAMANGQTPGKWCLDFAWSPATARRSPAPRRSCVI